MAESSWQPASALVVATRAAVDRCSPGNGDAPLVRQGAHRERRSPRSQKLATRAEEEMEYEPHYALRGQKTPPPGERPAPLSEVAGPQRSDRTVRHSAGVDGTTVSFLLAENLKLQKEEEKERRRKREEAQHEARMRELDRRVMADEQLNLAESYAWRKWAGFLPSEPRRKRKRKKKKLPRAPRPRQGCRRLCDHQPVVPGRAGSQVQTVEKTLALPQLQLAGKCVPCYVPPYLAVTRSVFAFGIQDFGLLCVMTSGNVSVFSAYWFNTGYMSTSVYRGFGKIFTYFLCQGGPRILKSMLFALIFQHAAQCLVRQWIHAWRQSTRPFGFHTAENCGVSAVAVFHGRRLLLHGAQADFHGLAVQQTTGIPQLQFLNEVIDVPVVPSRSHALVCNDLVCVLLINKVVYTLSSWRGGSPWSCLFR